MSLKPWRDVAVPHPDVAAGRYRQAEFAADLAQVLAGKAEPEYQDPVEFFARTYLTHGMTKLLTAAVERVAGKAGEPVVQLKTAFGGGKTHTMLALYHVFGGKADPSQLAGISEVLKSLSASRLPDVKVAVLVGTALDPTRPRKVKGLKATAHTLWGELAIQLGGPAAYELVERADTSGVAPGADTLVELFDSLGPCLILIDELVAYCRNIYGKTGLPSGSFDSNMTFVQSLTEAVKRSNRSLVVAAIPESDIEIGGEGGRAALERIENTFGRLEAVWKPVGALEGFEIVRRRLFTPLKDEQAREEVCRAFSRMYATADPTDFPADCREGTYLDRLRTAYPIHPEIFDRLYDDWASLERFQKTRGVLRLMAASIHELWVRDDRSLMILPGTLPLDGRRIHDELTRYLPEGWNAVIDKDVDGERSEPRQIDESNPRLGGHLAARRVARTIFLGSAPSVRQQQVRGIEDVRVRLGVVQPGEPVAVFNDALSRLTDRLTHLYSGNKRFWFDTQPNLRRTVEDRAGRLDASEVSAEIERRLRLVRERGDFSAIHVCPASADVPDEQEVRLVVLPVTSGHRVGQADSTAIITAAEILEKRGSSPRQYRNMLVFVTVDRELATGLEPEVRRFLAWQSVNADADTLNLDAHQRKQAAESVSRSDETVNIKLQEAYGWLLVPNQEGTGPIVWEAMRIAGGAENYVARATKKLKGIQQLIVRWSPALLRMELDKWLWKDQPHVSVKKVWECLCTYCYFPRLRDSEVLLDAIREGLRSKDYFGYASSVGTDGRYLGLEFGRAGGGVFLDDASVLVKPEVARRQLDEDASAEPKRARPYESIHSEAGTGHIGDNAAATGTAPTTPTTRLACRFHGSVQLDPTRVGRDAGRIAEEVVQHLSGLVSSNVEVTLEIQADVPGGVPDHVLRTVTENCRTLKFKTHGFEEQ